MWDYDEMGSHSKHDSYYDVAQICLEGHVTNPMAKDSPESNVKHCSTCGKKTITKCLECDADIRGYHHIPGVFGFGYSLPRHCNNCGEAFPWTKSRIEIAKEMIKETELEKNVKDELLNNVENIVRDTQRTELACTKFRNAIAKLNDEYKDMFKRVFMNIVTEKAKELLWTISPN